MDSPIPNLSGLSTFKPVKCVEKLTSHYQVSTQRRMQGDLMYLMVKFVDGSEVGVTCCINGFYRNDSSEKSRYDPTPTTRGKPCFATTLAGCLYQVNQNFARNLESHLNAVLAAEPYLLTGLQTPVQYKWIAEKEDGVDMSNFGADPNSIREWNEEFQVCKDLPKETLYQRIQRDRAFTKVYNDFLDAATKGAIAVINKYIQPLNPMDPEK